MPVYDSKWQKDDELGRVAWQVWDYVNRERVMYRNVFWEQSDEKPDDIQTLAGALGPFSNENWKDWWCAGQKSFLEAYPTVEDMRKILPTKANIRPAEKAKKQILNGLRGRFKSFAGSR